MTKIISKSQQSSLKIWFISHLNHWKYKGKFIDSIEIFIRVLRIFMCFIHWDSCYSQCKDKYIEIIIPKNFKTIRIRFIALKIPIFHHVSKA